MSNVYNIQILKQLWQSCNHDYYTHTANCHLLHEIFECLFFHTNIQQTQCVKVVCEICHDLIIETFWMELFIMEAKRDTVKDAEGWSKGR
jgi:hypothetical protein